MFTLTVMIGTVITILWGLNKLFNSKRMIAHLAKESGLTVEEYLEDQKNGLVKVKAIAEARRYKGHSPESNCCACCKK